jgi:gliding motility-associated-like protein
VLTLLIIDINGCPWQKDIHVVIEDVEAACSISSNNVLIGSSVTLSSSSSFNQYVWTDKIGDTISTEREVIVNDLQESDCFTVYVEDDNGCQDYCEICVTVGSKPFDAFSPNGDGYNDYWVIEDIDKFINPLVQIYNRWGELIFDESPTAEQCWDGTIDGKDAPVGTYYYIIDQNDGSELLKGSITLVR